MGRHKKITTIQDAEQSTPYKGEKSPYLTISAKGDELLITYQTGYSSYSDWVSVKIRRSKQDKQFVLLNIKP